MNMFVGELIFLCVIALLYRFVHKSTKKYLYLLGCVSILILTMFRAPSVGADTLNYCNGFRHIRDYLGWGELYTFDWEIGYVILNKVLGLFIKRDQCFIAAMTLIIQIPICLWLWRESEAPCMSLVVFAAAGFWQSSMFIYRQWCAIVILIFSLRFVRQRRLRAFLACVILACTFHRVAAVYLLVYFIYGIKSSSKLILGSLCTAGALTVAGPIVLKVLNRFARAESEAISDGGVIMLFTLWLIVLCVYILLQNSLEDNNFKHHFSNVSIAAATQTMTFTFSLWARIVLMFNLSLTVLLPNAFYKLAGKKNRTSVQILFWEGILIILMIVWFMIGGVEEYYFMWEM